MEPLTRTEQRWGEQLAENPGPGCLEAGALLALAAKGRRAPNADVYLAHLASCPACRRALKELREVETMALPASPGKFNWPRLLPIAAAVGTASVLLLVALWAAFGSLGDGERPLPIVKEQPAPAPEPVPTPNTVLPPAPKVAAPVENKLDEAKGTLAKRPRNRIRRVSTSPEKIDPPAPIAERPIETYDANSGWSRDEITGEVLGGNITTGEVTSPNLVQGEVGRTTPPPEQGLQRT